MADRNPDIGEHVTVIRGADGEVAATIHGPRPLDAEGREAVDEIVRVAKARMLEHPEMLAIQELRLAVRLARACIPDGPIKTAMFGEHDGAMVRDRLKAAVDSVHAALSPSFAAQLRERADLAAAALEEREADT
ncbi:hypothetical protein GCM10027258_62920 [Amycolatopsis stemonae]